MRRNTYTSDFSKSATCFGTPECEKQGVLSVANVAPSDWSVVK